MKINENCIGCGVCHEECPERAIFPAGSYQYQIDPEICTGCYHCLWMCDEKAISNEKAIS